VAGPPGGVDVQWVRAADTGAARHLPLCSNKHRIELKLSIEFNIELALNSILN
jgi:hypothetical protein